ncbi:MAG: hypothetical protein WBF71_14375 [Microthrixaceae bacterium]
MKKGRHRRYEEARALKRGPDLDIDALFTDLEGEPVVVATGFDDSTGDSSNGNRSNTSTDDDAYSYESGDDDGYDDDVYKGR